MSIDALETNVHLDFDVPDTEKTNFEILQKAEKANVAKTNEVVGVVSQIIQPGIANTERVAGEYQFEAGSELDYSASVAAATTVTFAELPTNTIAIHVYCYIQDGASNNIYYNMRRKVTDAFSFYVPMQRTTSGGGTHITAGVYWLPTYQNSIYFFQVAGVATTRFVIFGYQVK